jgi:UDP-N-acetylmuramyl pentapeptide phosphotransferase/UDP-N-acetylglucosamine-1-phosphate transferase
MIYFLSYNLYFIIKFISLIIFFIILNNICIKSKIFLLNNSISHHKNFISHTNAIPISGGFFLLFSNIILQEDFFFNYYNLFYLCFFVVGIFADLSKNFKPILRIVIQIIIVGLLIYICDILIKDVKISLFNFLLNINFFSLIFTTFCILIFVNGSNLIDGVNLSAISYFLLIFFVIYILSINNNFHIDIEFIKIQIILMVIIFGFNFFNKSYLGDSGIYLLSLTTSLLIIKFINKNNSISPYFAVLLLWYPCFENLFTIIRRVSKGIRASVPDNSHFHHLIYLFLNKKKISYSNNITGLIIFSFNLPIILVGYKFYNKTQILIFIIFFAIFLYLLFYFILKKKLKT